MSPTRRKRKDAINLEESPELQRMAMYIAMAVRNNIEDCHYFLTDEQMKSLNQRTRDAVYTALYAATYKDVLPGAADFVDFQMLQIPSYWEKPTLMSGFVGGVEDVGRNPEHAGVFRRMLARNQQIRASLPASSRRSRPSKKTGKP